MTRPFRKVVDERKGAGSDHLTLDCGHAIVVNHRSYARKKARCFRCEPINRAIEPIQ